jgi:hypothetical protein
MDESKTPSNPFGIVPLSYFVPRGFGFVHHSIAILYHQVPNPNITIRNFCIAVPHTHTLTKDQHGSHRQRQHNDASEPTLLLS